jgi:hypothetical protein
MHISSTEKAKKIVLVFDYKRFLLSALCVSARDKVLRFLLYVGSLIHFEVFTYDC